MDEEKIIIKIDKDGKMTSEVKGVIGPSCVDKIEELLSEIAEIEDMKKTDEYFMDVNVLNTQKTHKKVEVKK